MNGQWTYSNKSYKWEHDSFPTREEALQHAGANYNHKCYIGQLVEHGNLEFVVDNIQEVIL